MELYEGWDASVPARYLVNFDLDDLPTVRTDIVIIGSGIAGLYTALGLHKTGKVLLLTKRRLEDSNTEYAQGGIAAALGPGDSPHLHMQDTLEAGAGLCDWAAVDVLVREGPGRVLDLVRMGAHFDKCGDSFAITREGAHGRPRILHARGDATGDEIRRALQAEIVARDIDVRENHTLVDILTNPDGRAVGVLALNEDGELMAVLARAIVLATGGIGQLYSSTTNPDIATGDGIAAAYRAGAQLADMEFVQFHPTALASPDSPRFLISEALRGEGALLLNARGERFMPAVHPQAELAPRDVVARAIWREMQESGQNHVWLDARPIGPELPKRFPTIYRHVASALGLDMLKEPILVAPAAHYMMGGVVTNLAGATRVPGLYACGETACTGVHGANRLASNSLLEGLVFGGRIAEHLQAHLREAPPIPAKVHLRAEEHAEPADKLDVQALTAELKEIMWRYVGIVRDAEGLAQAEAQLQRLINLTAGVAPREDFIEVANMARTGFYIARGASARHESRGGHYRSDYPEPNDRKWQVHVVQTWGQTLVLCSQLQQEGDSPC